MNVYHGHTHLFVAWDDFTRTDGQRVIYSRCVCMIEERRWFDGPEPVKVEYRLAGGAWINPLDLIRMFPLPVKLCPQCDGNTELTGPLCGACRGLGVVEQDDAPVKLNAPSKYTEVAVRSSE